MSSVTRGLGMLFCLALGMTGCVTRQSSPPAIYDPHANGEQQLAAALAEATREQKRVLLNLGANWCSDSQKMFEVLQSDPELRRMLRSDYVLVMVDANQRDGAARNTNVMAQLGSPLERGIPVLLVLTSDGELLNKDPEERLADSDHQFPEKVRTYLRQWAR